MSGRDFLGLAEMQFPWHSRKSGTYFLLLGCSQSGWRAVSYIQLSVASILNTCRDVPNYKKVEITAHYFSFQKSLLSLRQCDRRRGWRGGWEGRNEKG